MHTKRALSYTIRGFAVWSFFFIIGAFFIGTDAFRLFPGMDPRRIIGGIIFLCSLIALVLQTYSSLSLFRAYTGRDKETRRWDALLLCLLGCLVHFGVGTPGAAFGLFCLIGELPTAEDD